MAEPAQDRWLLRVSSPREEQAEHVPHPEMLPDPLRLRLLRDGQNLHAVLPATTATRPAIPTKLHANKNKRMMRRLFKVVSSARRYLLDADSMSGTSTRPWAGVLLTCASMRVARQPASPASRRGRESGLTGVIVGSLAEMGRKIGGRSEDSQLFVGSSADFLVAQ